MSSLESKLKAFLADDEIPADIRKLVESRIYPAPKWVPGPEEIERDNPTTEE